MSSLVCVSSISLRVLVIEDWRWEILDCVFVVVLVVVVVVFGRLGLKAVVLRDGSERACPSCADGDGF